MHRRFLFPLAAGVVGLLAISPVFAAEPSPAKAGSGPGRATTTTANNPPATTGNTSPSAPPQQPGPPAHSGGSSSQCGAAQTDQGPAPQAGEAPQNHSAGDAGTVDVERASPTDLRVAKANPNNGWQPEVTAPSGPRITVKFTHPGGSPSIIHFAATMDQAGRMIHTRVQSCG